MECSTVLTEVQAELLVLVQSLYQACDFYRILYFQLLYFILEMNRLQSLLCVELEIGPVLLV